MGAPGLDFETWEEFLIAFAPRMKTDN